MLRTAARAVLAVGVLGGCIKPPPPNLKPHPLPEAPLPPSSIDVPSKLELQPVFTLIENSVQKSWPSEGAWTYPPGHDDVRYKYYAERAPFALAMNGSVLTLGTVVNYRAEGQKKVLFAWIGGSCGYGGEWPRQIRVGFASTATITPDYGLSTSTSLNDLTPLNTCNVTFLGIDVTGSIIDAVRSPLNSAASTLDANTKTFTAKPAIERGWSQVESPQSLSNSAWILINPFEVRFGGLNGQGSTLSTSFGMSAKPTVVTGPRPTTPIVQLPTLTVGQPASGFHVISEASIDHTTASRLLSDAVRGSRLNYGSRHITLSSARVYGAGSDTLVVRIGFSGSKHGYLYLYGRPQLESISQTLTVPDLDYTVETKDLLTKVAAWLLDAQIRQLLRSKAQWDLKPTLSSVKAELTAALNHNLGNGVALRGSVDDLEAIGILADGIATHVRLRADGTVSTVVTASTVSSIP
jgi:uncharacterized protein DUF4403